MDLNSILNTDIVLTNDELVLGSLTKTVGLYHVFFSPKNEAGFSVYF